MKNKEVLAIKGHPFCGNEDYVNFNCGTYIVRVWTGGLAFYLCNALQRMGFADKHKLLKFCRSNRLKKWYRALLYRYDAKTLLHIMEEKGLVIRGSGTNYNEAICDLFDKSSFKVITTDDENKLSQEDKEFLDVLLHPEKLSANASYILEYMRDKENFLHGYPLSTIHSKEMAEKTYITIESLEESKLFSSMTKTEICRALAELYQNHCIVILDKVPVHKIPDDIKDFKLHEIFA